MGRKYKRKRNKAIGKAQRPKPSKRMVEAARFRRTTNKKCSRGEKLMKELLGFIFPSEFYVDNVWPPWLLGLELDRYYPALKIACEYQGFQHLYFTPAFHSSTKAFERQQARDRRKVELCAKHNVSVVAIFPYHLAVGVIRNLIHATKQKKAVAAMVPASRRKARRRELDNKCLDYKGMLANYRL